MVRYLGHVRRLHCILFVRRHKQVKQFNVLGHIPEARRIDADDRFHILAMFASVYGVGHVTARLWYAHGHRTLTDVMDSNSEKLNYLQEKGLEYHQDFSQKMSRADVEELIRYIRQGLDVLDPGITLEAVGGYSRGKTENGDLDVVISHPNAGREKTLLADVVKHFQNEGFILDVMYQGQSSPVEHIGPNKQSGGHGFDKLDKCFAAVRQPSTRTLRQVDFIISPYEVLSCALIGWQGSTLFERDLKRWCQSRGYKFYSHGLFRIKTGEKIEVRSPKQFFDILGLPYLDPTVRNC
ncbi:Nucleotidyltransferase [Gonapodya prolifera JEL478]|uniref:DNA polymerase n=1 Tax=Gonapodya prolifera (strain JEL478) TaxID=1344416 RepID=A0A139AY58_GONPJ|nr:Nucleotidyltransferase [Gonapodya prolifera JEL478]|eukprot:KXS21682.1 Nucleotidyltransferase [Gonapodya prolifera JEL478]